MAGYHPPVEEYLETVLELEESGILPMRARLVERLHVSAPAVSETVARLEREGYLTLDEGRIIRLTPHGREFASTVMRRHRLAERLLTDVIGVPWSQVHEEAGRLEHAISPTLEPYLVKLLGDPATCPHGNPIPGSANSRPPTVMRTLSTFGGGDEVVVRRIDEELEAQIDQMRTLERDGMMPGQRVAVSGSANGSMNLVVDGASVSVVESVAALVYVTAA